MAEMGIYEAMRTLRAVRRLKPDPIPDAVLQRVLEAATWAPTGGNRQPWRIIAVKDPAKKTQLGTWYAERWGAFSKLYRTSIPADLPEDGRKRMLRTIAAGDYLGQHFGETPVIAIFCFNPKEMAITDAKQPRPSVVGGGSIYPAVENLLLACRAEGLGCVLTTLLCEVEPQVKELLAIPAGWGTAAAIPIGYPVGSGHGPIVRRPVRELTYLDGWGNRIA
jgi:nitroreductase